MHSAFNVLVFRNSMFTPFFIYEEEKLYFNNLLHLISIHFKIHDTVDYCGKKSEDEYVCIRYSPMKQYERVMCSIEK